MNVTKDKRNNLRLFMSLIGFYDNLKTYKLLKQETTDSNEMRV